MTSGTPREIWVTVRIGTAIAVWFAARPSPPSRQPGEVARLDAVVDQTRIIHQCAETFPQILEKTHMNIAPLVTRTIARPFAACGWWATVVE